MKLLDRDNKLDCALDYFNRKTEAWLEKDYMPMSWWKYDIAIELSKQHPAYDWRMEGNCRSIFDILLHEKDVFYIDVDKKSGIKKYRLVNNCEYW